MTSSDLDQLPLDTFPLCLFPMFMLYTRYRVDFGSTVDMNFTARTHVHLPLPLWLLPSIHTKFNSWHGFPYHCHVVIREVISGSNLMQLHVFVSLWESWSAIVCGVVTRSQFDARTSLHRLTTLNIHSMDNIRSCCEHCEATVLASLTDRLIHIIPQMSLSTSR